MSLKSKNCVGCIGSVEPILVMMGYRRGNSGWWRGDEEFLVVEMIVVSDVGWR